MLTPPISKIDFGHDFLEHMDALRKAIGNRQPDRNRRFMQVSMNSD
jgi:hypothetical protein